MGEAKRRGTFEQRKQSATPRMKKMSARELDIFAKKAAFDFIIKRIEQRRILEQRSTEHPYEHRQIGALND